MSDNFREVIRSILTKESIPIDTIKCIVESETIEEIIHRTISLGWCILPQYQVLRAMDYEAILYLYIVNRNDQVTLHEDIPEQLINRVHGRLVKSGVYSKVELVGRTFKFTKKIELKTEPMTEITKKWMQICMVVYSNLLNRHRGKNFQEEMLMEYDEQIFGRLSALGYDCGPKIKMSITMEK